MKHVTKNRLKIASSLALCLLSLFAALSATLSWFAINDRTHGDGMQIQVEDETMILGCRYFKLSRLNGAIRQDGETDSLGVYGALGGETSVAVKIYLSEQCGERIKLSAQTATDYFLGDVVQDGDGNVLKSYPLLPPRTDTPELPDDEGKDYTNVLSSIVSFAVLTETEADALEAGTLASLPKNARTKSFVDPKATDRAPKSEISLIQSTEGGGEIATQADTYEGQACRSVYVVIAYDSLLVNTVFSANIGNSAMFMEKEDGTLYDIPFVCDFSLSVAQIGEE